MPSVDRLPSGSYRVRVSYNQDGKRKTKTFTGKNKRELLHKAAMWENSGEMPMTLEAAIASYIELKSEALSPSTIKAYKAMERSIAKNMPDIYRRNLRDITVPMLQRSVDSLCVAPKTIKNMHALITSAFTNSGFRSPSVVLPKRVKPTYRIPTEEEMRLILEKAEGTRLYIPIQLAVLGLRRGEVCGLKAEDLKGTRLHIHHSLVLDSSNKYVLKGTKTEASDRYIEIPEELADQIRKNGVTDMTPAMFSSAFKRFLRANDLPDIRLHDLRHFFASYCHNILHLSSAQIQKMGGWETDYVMKQSYIQSMEDKRANDLVKSALESFVTHRA